MFTLNAPPRRHPTRKGTKRSGKDDVDAPLRPRTKSKQQGPSRYTRRQTTNDFSKCLQMIRPFADMLFAFRILSSTRPRRAQVAAGGLLFATHLTMEQGGFTPSATHQRAEERPDSVKNARPFPPHSKKVSSESW